MRRLVYLKALVNTGPAKRSGTDIWSLGWQNFIRSIPPSMASLQLTSLQPFSAPVIPRRMTLVAAGLDLALEGQYIQVVAPGQDPIAVISAALREAPSNELHLVAHGASGLIELGRGIDRSALLARVAEISGWGVERIYLWSCRVGADLNFVSALQELSGARVFSSAEALGQGKSLMGSGFEALAEAVEALPWQLSVLLSLYSGGFVDETSWNVRNSQGQAISWGGPYGYGLNTTVDTNINLGGSYTFSIETQGWYNDNWANYNIYEASSGQSYLSGYIGGGSALTREFTIQGGQSNQNIDLGRVSVAQANAEDANTTGVVTATISDQSISSLSGLTGTGNAYSITVTDSSVNAADLNTLDSKTTVNVNAAPVGTLTGTASAIDTAINAGSIDTAGNVAVNINSGSTTVAQANNIDAQTTGVITAAVDSGSIATLNGLTGTNNAYALTVTDTSATGSDLNTLDGKTTGTINAGTVASITGTATDVKTLYASNGFSGLGDESVSVSDSVSVADANSIDGSTSGVITAAISDTTISTLGGLTGTGNAYSITVTDSSVNAADLNNLDGRTTLTVNANAINSISGTATQVTTTFNSAGISNLNIGDDSITISDTTLSGSDPTSLNAGSGTDSLNSTGLFAQALSIFDSDSGTLGSITFSNLENITLGSGDDTATIGSAGALTGSLDLGSGNNFLSYSSYGNAVKATVNGTNSLSSTTAIGAGVTGVENVTLSSNDDTVNFESGGSLHSLDGGDGSDTLNLKATSGYEITLTGNDKGSFKELNSNLSTGFSAFENIYAGDADETLTFKEGASLSGTLDLGGGRNTVKIEGGTALIDAVIQGGSGSDVMAFEAPKGSQTGSITAYINAGAGDDVVQLEGGFLPIGSSSNSSPQTILGSAISDLKQSLQDAAKSGHLQKAAVEAGIDNNTSDKTRLSTIGQHFQDGNFADLPAFRLVDSVHMDGALGAYIKNANTIAVDQDWLKTASQEDINSVLVEEIGHYLDSIVNVLDTPGEEGQIFSEALLGYSTSGSKIPATVNPDNTVSVSLDGVHLLNGEANQSIPMVGENFRPNLVVDGGAGHDKLDLSNGFDLTYSADFARSGGLGEFVNYAADPTDETLSSQFLSAKFSGFENVTLDKTSQETAAVSDVRLMGVQDTTMDSGADLAAVYGVAANSSANSSSIADGVSSYSAGFSIGIEDGSLTAGDALSTTISFGANSSTDAHSVADDANAVAVGYGVGLDHTDLTAGSSLDLVIKDASQVAANAFTATGDVFAVASNDGIGATDLTAIGDSAVEAMFTFNLGNSANAITTVGNAEAVGWIGSSGLDDSSMSSGGIGVINVSVRGVNGVGAESVTGDTSADALSAMVGINNTSFDFADTSSTIASTISNETTSSSSSILGNAISGLTSTVFGLFGGTNSGDTIANTKSVSSIISDYGFSEAASVGGSATATANQSIEGITGYSLATTDSILIYSKSSIDSTASSSAEDS